MTICVFMLNSIVMFSKLEVILRTFFTGIRKVLDRQLDFFDSTYATVTQGLSKNTVDVVYCLSLWLL